MKKIIGWLIAVNVVLVGILEWENVRDWVSGLSYQPSGEMVAIREKLALTGRGEFLFNAVQPALMGGEEFNTTCAKIDVETAILGCYTGERIYVYNVTEADLAGILEATTAHELLHAVYERMSSKEKAQVEEDLETVLAENREILEEDLALYAESEWMEELYVRAGTEVKDLPEALEEHYAEIFTDQDAIVQYYNNYSGKFREIEQKLDDLAAEMEALEGEIEQKTEKYEVDFENLEAEIAEFNDCADTLGCFASESEFYSRRNALESARSELGEDYDELDGLVDLYNEKVEEYNAEVMVGKKYNRAINSGETVDSV